MNRRSFIAAIFALPLLKHLPKPKFVGIPIRCLDQMSFADVCKRQDSAMLPVIEALSKNNPLLKDMVWSEDDVQIGHRISTRKIS